MSGFCTSRDFVLSGFCTFRDFVFVGIFNFGILSFGIMGCRDYEFRDFVPDPFMVMIVNQCFKTNKKTKKKLFKTSCFKSRAIPMAKY